MSKFKPRPTQAECIKYGDVAAGQFDVHRQVRDAISDNREAIFDLRADPEIVAVLRDQLDLIEKLCETNYGGGR